MIEKLCVSVALREFNSQLQWEAAQNLSVVLSGAFLFVLLITSFFSFQLFSLFGFKPIGSQLDAFVHRRWRVSETIFDQVAIGQRTD